jgi:hypothetical protein
MNDKIIRFPGAKGAETPQPAASEAPAASPTGAPVVGPDGMTDDQRKAVQIVLGGMSFVLVGVRPTDRGADFFTAVHGDHTELRNALPHLDGVIERAFGRKGIIQ